MKILTLNCGSSSVKYALFDMPKKIRLCHGIVNRINLGRSFIEHYNHDSQKYIYDHECPNHTIAIKLVTDLLVSQENGVISSLFDIDAVGHRVVHGGQEFTKPVIINKEIERKIDKYSSLAPLHNPVNLAGIRATMQLMPNIPNAAVFDTAFFATLPAHVYIYGLPYEWYVKYGIRKYGFHGTSHQYVSRRVAILLGKKPQEINIITLHIGNGVSVTAVKAGEAYDHSMGFTPLEGAIMGTRCGDIDPAIPLYIMKQEKLDCDDMEDILNNKSGLLGISG